MADQLALSWSAEGVYFPWMCWPVFQSWGNTICRLIKFSASHRRSKTHHASMRPVVWAETEGKWFKTRRLAQAIRADESQNRLSDLRLWGPLLATRGSKNSFDDQILVLVVWVSSLVALEEFCKLFTVRGMPLLDVFLSQRCRLRLAYPGSLTYLVLQGRGNTCSYIPCHTKTQVT